VIRSAAIVGTGMAVPPKVLTNADLTSIVDTTDEWIVSRTGIRERRVVEDGQATSDLGAAAARAALAAAGVAADAVDLILVATLSPDMICPSTACLVQEKLGAKRAAAADVAAACSGFVYGLSLARGAIVAGEAETVLLIGAEVTSRFVDWKDRTTCVLFGDAAGAAVLRPSYNGRGILGTVLGADGGGASLIEVPAGGSRAPASHETVDGRGHYLKLKGQDVFKAGVRSMSLAVEDVLRKCGLSKDDVALLIPHQANRRILDAVADNLGFPRERMFLNLDRYGNTSAATIPVALHEAVAGGRLKPGDVLCTVAFGGGLTWGAAAVRM
jgi:3-oxoacyl-[acyl-carrier-protein] synthase-3